MRGDEVTGTGQLQPQDPQATGTGYKQLNTDHSIVFNNKETPVNPAVIVPKRLFGRKKPVSIEDFKDRNINNNINEDIEEMNVEILLINTLMITAVKIQTVIENFIKNKDYTSIFCFTETKVDSLSFKPIGIKIFSKHRKKKEKKRGGLLIGYKNDKKTKLEEIKVDSNDILALEGTVRGSKIRIILSYFDSTKNKSGRDYDRNRKIQKTIEKLMEVEPDVALVCLGDINGRLTRLEPNIATDVNGKMLEEWTSNFSLHHLNLTDNCIGTYTFNSNKGKSAIDHILVNNLLYADYKGMHIDEDKIALNISDHCLVRAWFKLGTNKRKIDWKRTRTKEIQWIKKDEESLKEFEEAFIPKIGKSTTFKGCMEKIKSTLNSTLKKKKRIKVGKRWKQTILAVEWVDSELLDNISLRNKLSREWRVARKNGEPDEVIETCKKRYEEQQKRTTILSGSKKGEWEKKKIEETWKDGKKFWTMIKELLGKDKEKDEETFVYTIEGEKKEIMEFSREFTDGWKQAVYQKTERVDFSFWYGNDDIKGSKAEMEEEMKNGNSGIMEFPVIKEEELMKVIRNMKNGKASGVDGVNAELMKYITKNERIKTYVLKCFNNALKERIHGDWLISKTTMIPKTEKPKIMEDRPIAVTVNSSKIICTILREKIEEYFKENNIVYENQYGFTEGGRIEHCLFILDYIANMTYESKNNKNKSLFYAFIDFKKAYVSINRGKLIEVLIKFKINPQIINLIVQMYEDDKTTIQLGRMKETIEVTGGIRQGCSISTLLFKMVTFTIIENLRNFAERYNIREYNENSLWLADDATIIAKDEPSMLEILKVLETAGKENGLELSEEKTKILRIRGPKIEGKIGRFNIEKEARYLGIQVGGRGRNIFEAENKIWIQKAEKKANAIISQIKKSVDKVIVGKAIWKLMAIPAILFGRAVVTTSKSNIERLQRLENKVWRYLLGIGGYATIEALRGEIGASMVKSRIMETMLLYMVDTMASRFTNVKNMMKDTIVKKKGRWYNAINEYRIELEMTWEKLENIDRPTLKKMIRAYDTEKWKDGLRKKTSLRFYGLEKWEIRYELCYRNNNSKFYARARMNTLKLEEHKGRGQKEYNKICKLCKEEEEDLVHFISKCKKLESKRNYNLLDKNTEDPEERMRKLLFRDERHQEIGKQIKDLWDLRRELMKKLNKDLDKKLNVKPIQKNQASGAKADKPTNRCRKKTQKGDNDSGSIVDTTQGCNGSGPMIFTTQGCIGSGPMLHMP